MFPDQTAHHPFQVYKCIVQVDDPGLDDLAPGKNQQLIREMSRPLGSRFDFFDLFANLNVRLHQGQLGIAGNDGQEIVEIMGNAAGQTTDGLHLLGL